MIWVRLILWGASIAGTVYFIARLRFEQPVWFHPEFPIFLFLAGLSLIFAGPGRCLSMVMRGMAAISFIDLLLRGLLLLTTVESLSLWHQVIVTLAVAVVGVGAFVAIDPAGPQSPLPLAGVFAFIALADIAAVRDVKAGSEVHPYDPGNPAFWLAVVCMGISLAWGIARAAGQRGSRAVLGEPV